LWLRVAVVEEVLLSFHLAAVVEGLVDFYKEQTSQLRLATH
jgi:hypothetical protein